MLRVVRLVGVIIHPLHNLNKFGIKISRSVLDWIPNASSSFLNRLNFISNNVPY